MGEKDKKELVLPSHITVKELAEQLELSPTEIITDLMKNGVTASLNELIDYETAAVVALDFGISVKPQTKKEKILDIKERVKESLNRAKNLIPRPPVVTVMGHVDHGKTLLLDAIRETNVVASEAGGITQHIGAYQVEVNGKLITFLDTPGHEAFQSMRQRGASVTDIVVLVIAADDKIQPQTIEAISHAKKASLPIIVAINKIDLPQANPERIKQELAQHGLVPEDRGGKTVCVPVSAKTKEGIPTLLEMILLVAEMEDLKADFSAKALGVVLESHLDKGKGPQATILIMNGTLKPLDNFVVGEYTGRVRTMENFLGERIKKAMPATPVVISGISGVPEVGEIFEVVSDETEAKEKAFSFIKEKHAKHLPAQEAPNSKNKKYQLNLIIKTDVSGSLEAIKNKLSEIDIPEVGVKIIHSSIGDITESDVIMAASSQALIVGFHVKARQLARKSAKQKNVEIIIHQVIYELIQEVKERMIKLIPPKIEEVSQGKLKVLKIFKSDNSEFIIGGKVLKGILEKNSKIKIIRNNQTLGEGVILNIKKYEKDVPQVKENEECGLNLRTPIAPEIDDIIESIKEEMIKPEV